MSSGKILIERGALNLKMMLTGGQCFRWKEISVDEYFGTVSGKVWLVKQFDDRIEYEIIGCLPPLSSRVVHPNQFLRNYLRLDSPLSQYYYEWSRRDPNFQKVAEKCFGIRILDQDPVENVFSFICSSNNNIKRISGLVEKLCKMYGPKICENNGTAHYGFPELPSLAASEESELRAAGFGYRAKFIHNAARQIQDFGGIEWLLNLKNVPYLEAKTELMKLTGIGAKVADCICLMSLGHMEALPVDTHVYQIAAQTYIPHLRKVKNMTDRIYNEIGDFFRELYGPLAGWAHTVLFCGDLKAFKDKNEKAEVTYSKSSSPGRITSEELLPPRNGLPSENNPLSDSSDASEQPSDKKISSPFPSENINETQSISKSKRKSLQEDYEVVSGVLKCSRKDLNLKIALKSGQTYRFKELSNDTWRGVFASTVWTLKQYEHHIDFKAYSKRRLNSKKSKSSSQTDSDKINFYSQLLQDYFRLDFPLSEHYKKWSSVDEHFLDISEKFSGLRMIRQDIVENLFAFICSSCNTIDRMSSMVATMCSEYGDKILSIDEVSYFDFPPVDRLAGPSVADHLTKAGFGYRAKYIQKAAEHIVARGGSRWFEELKSMSYEEAKKTLMDLPGVAAKVADCICLTALDHLETIPVDTHVFQIAKRYYLPHLKNQKTVSVKTYSEIGDFFRNKFSPFAGWAHTVLFCADLKQHKDLLL